MSRIPPPAALGAYLKSISSPPTPRAGGPVPMPPHQPIVAPPSPPPLNINPFQLVGSPPPPASQRRVLGLPVPLVERVLLTIMNVLLAVVVIFAVLVFLGMLLSIFGKNAHAQDLGVMQVRAVHAERQHEVQWEGLRRRSRRRLVEADAGCPERAREPLLVDTSPDGGAAPQPIGISCTTIVILSFPPQAADAVTNSGELHEEMDAGLPPLEAREIVRTDTRPRDSYRGPLIARLPRLGRMHVGALGVVAALIALIVAVRRRENSSSETPSRNPLMKKRSHHLGAHSATGPVRETNQDRVRATSIDGADVIVVCDGLGGLPRGGEAAAHASTFAINRLRRELPTLMKAGPEAVRTLLLSTIWATATRLAEEAHARGWTNMDDGFRTTIILGVAIPDLYLSAWVGDGGVFVVRKGGTIVKVLEPHKAPDTPDLLDASLGPTTDGRPSWAMVAREEGDLLVVATDGIADSFDAALASLVQDRLQAVKGHAANAAKAVVEDLAARTDADGGHLFTDNLTLALSAPGATR